MNQIPEDNRRETSAGSQDDPLDRVERELSELPELDPAEAADVLADIAVELNRELDADADRS